MNQRFQMGTREWFCLLSTCPMPFSFLLSLFLLIVLYCFCCSKYPLFFVVVFFFFLFSSPSQSLA